MKRIFPFNPLDVPKWYNWSNYLCWLDNEINSIKQYLTLFNADFCMINEEIPSISSSTMQESVIPMQKKDNPWKPFIADGVTDVMYICFPGELSWRQGIFATYYLAYVCVDPTIVVLCEIDNKTGYKLKDNKNFSEEVLNGNLVKIEPSTMIFAHSWMKTIQSNYNTNYYNMDRYKLISRPYAGAYVPTCYNGQLVFKFVKDAQGTMGDNISLAVELLPNRYFCTQSDYLRWPSDNLSFSITAASWAGATKPIKKIIENSKSQIWTGAYPLMHECRINLGEEDNPIWEEFIFDHTAETQAVNIANHGTIEYTITAEYKQDEQEAMKKLLKLVRVEIL